MAPPRRAHRNAPARGPGVRLARLPAAVHHALRKAALAFDVATDARKAIGRLPERDRERARVELAAQLAEAMQELEEGDEQRGRLADLHRELTQHGAGPLDPVRGVRAGLSRK